MKRFLTVLFSLLLLSTPVFASEWKEMSPEKDLGNITGTEQALNLINKNPDVCQPENVDIEVKAFTKPESLDVSGFTSFPNDLAEKLNVNPENYSVVVIEANENPADFINTLKNTESVKGFLLSLDRMSNLLLEKSGTCDGLFDAVSNIRANWFMLLNGIAGRIDEGISENFFLAFTSSEKEVGFTLVVTNGTDGTEEDPASAAVSMLLKVKDTNKEDNSIWKLFPEPRASKSAREKMLGLKEVDSFLKTNGGTGDNIRVTLLTTTSEIDWNSPELNGEFAKKTGLKRRNFRPLSKDPTEEEVKELIKTLKKIFSNKKVEFSGSEPEDFMELVSIAAETTVENIIDTLSGEEKFNVFYTSNRVQKPAVVVFEGAKGDSPVNIGAILIDNVEIF